MDTSRLARLLERKFARIEPVDVAGAQVQTLRKPLPLGPMLEQVLDPGGEQEEYSGTFQAWPGNLHELLDQHRLVRGLVTFSHDGFGPVSWSYGFQEIRVGGRCYLVFWDELDSYRLLASIAPRNRTALRAVVREAIAGASLLQGVPHHIFNDAPSLLSRRFIEQTFTELLDQTDGWSSLAEEHFGRIVEPNHLQRCLDILSGLPRLDDHDALDRWLDARETDADDVPPAVRRRLLREFIDSGYEVRR